MTDVARLGVAELSAHLQRRELSAGEVTAAFLARIREVDGTHGHDGDPGSINAWVRVYEEDALEAAARADERLSDAAVRRDGPAPPLTGVPIGLKDLYGVAGKPVTASSGFFEEVPAQDCDAWAQLSAAGMVLLGHLHTHEFAVGGTTDQVGSPWDLRRSPGGSSGGSAAALAARMTPAATGTDTAGSLRIPSACCGTSAIKPTRGLVSLAGVVPLSWSLDHAGPDGADDLRLRSPAPRDGRPRPRARRERAARPSPLRIPRRVSKACASPSLPDRRGRARPGRGHGLRRRARGVPPPRRGGRRAAGARGARPDRGRLPRRPDHRPRDVPPPLRRAARPLPRLDPRVARGGRASRGHRRGVRRGPGAAAAADRRVVGVAHGAPDRRRCSSRRSRSSRRSAATATTTGAPTTRSSR